MEELRADAELELEIRVVSQSHDFRRKDTEAQGSEPESHCLLNGLELLVPTKYVSQRSRDQIWRAYLGRQFVVAAAPTSYKGESSHSNPADLAPTQRSRNLAISTEIVGQ